MNYFDFVLSSKHMAMLVTRSDWPCGLDYPPVILGQDREFYLHCVHPDFGAHPEVTGDCLSWGGAKQQECEVDYYIHLLPRIIFTGASYPLPPNTWCSIQHGDNFELYGQAEHHLFDKLERTLRKTNLFLIPVLSRSRCSNVVHFPETPIDDVSIANSRFQKAGIGQC